LLDGPADAGAAEAALAEFGALPALGAEADAGAFAEDGAAKETGADVAAGAAAEAGAALAAGAEAGAGGAPRVKFNVEPGGRKTRAPDAAAATCEAVLE